jgi:hypothetical protein
LVIVAATAVALGYFVSFIGQWFYLILIFPLAIGIGVGCAGLQGIVLGGIPNHRFAGAVGLLGGALAMGAQHYCDYQRFLVSVAQEEPALHAQLAAGGFSFFQFMEARAREGVTLAHLGAGKKSGMNLGYVGSLVYWLIEMVIIGGIAHAIMTVAAKKPYCDACGRWKNQRLLANLFVSPQQGKELIDNGELVELRALALAAVPRDFAGHLAGAQGPLHLHVYCCPHCDQAAPVVVVLQQVTINDQGQLISLGQLARCTYPGTALPILRELSLLSPAPPLAGV